MIQLYDSQGERLTLGKELGRGGEGSVLAVSGRSDLVAKIYHEPISQEKVEKLRQMVALKTDRILRLAAWVTDVLQNEKGETVGFLMPRLSFGTAIHELYNPASRRRRFPDADWRFLIRAAANTARAFAVVHAHNHVIGDVNHGNVVIARDATVRLIDCDSYHLNAPERSFLCEVGVSTHTPPELQGKSLREISRSANHDNFGLAVLIFQLLFMGRHPFSGKFLGGGENTLENSIKERRFAYGDDAAARKMQPPPGTLPLAAVPPVVAALFRRAFLEIGNRPPARQWADALDELENDLCECRLNSAHFYWKNLAECVWCRLETETGVLFFPPRFNVEIGADADLDLLTIGRLIDLIKPPDVPANLPVKFGSPPNSQLIMPLSPRVAETLVQFRKRLVIYLACLSFSIITLISLGGFFLLFFLGLLVAGCILSVHYLTEGAQKETQFALDAARRNWEKFQNEWKRLASSEPFANARGDLKKALAEFKNLSAEREAALKKLETERRRRQLEFYLKGFSISRAGIKHLTPAHIKQLRAARVVSAHDVTTINFRRLREFNPALENRLFAWRAELENNFIFNPDRQKQCQSEQEINAEFEEKRIALENKIRTGVPRLQQVSLQITEDYRKHSQQAEGFELQLAAAESDFERVANLKTAAVGWTIGIAFVSVLISVPVRATFVYPGVNRDQTPIVYKTAEKGSAQIAKGFAMPAPNLRQIDNYYLADGTHITPENWGKAFEYYQNGVNQVAAGDYDTAAKSFRKAIDLKPETSDLRVSLGEAFHLSGDYSSAIVAFNDALKINPNNSNAYHLLGESYNKLLRRSDAIRAFKKAAEVNPRAFYSLYELGKTLREDKKPNEAINYLSEALKKSPDFAEAHFELALCYSEAGFRNLAVKEYDKLKIKDAELASKLAEKLGVKTENATKQARSSYAVDEG